MTKAMLQARLQKLESMLGMQRGLNTVLQEKIQVLVRKCDERDQRIYTMATAMRKVERDADKRSKALEAEHKAILNGDNYRAQQEELRSRAAMILDRSATKT